MLNQVCQWKMADVPQPDLPRPTDGQGWTVVNGNIQPLWFHGPVVQADIAEEDDNLNDD
jgi:hypothetical protein